MNEKQKKGKAARDRGARGERMLVEILRDFYGYKVRRGNCFNHESDLVGLPKVHIECKYQEKLNLRQAMEQSIHDAGYREEGVPVVMHKKAREEWLVTMRLTDWMDFYGEWAKDDV